MKSYEIWNLTTGEIIADNLNFDDVPELFGAYADFFPCDNIIVCCRKIKIATASVRPINAEEANRKKFHREWFDFIENLLTMDNIH